MAPLRGASNLCLSPICYLADLYMTGFRPLCRNYSGQVSPILEVGGAALAQGVEPLSAGTQLRHIAFDNPAEAYVLHA